MTAIFDSIDISALKIKLKVAIAQRSDIEQEETLGNGLLLISKELSGNDNLRLNRLRVAAMRLLFLHIEELDGNSLSDEKAKSLHCAVNRSINITSDEQWDCHNMVASAGYGAAKLKLEHIASMRQKEGVVNAQIDSLIARALTRLSFPMTDDEFMAWSIPVSKLYSLQFVDDEDFADYKVLVDYVTVVMDALSFYM